MSDKADDISSMRISVGNTLIEAIKMFDAVPMSNDSAKEYWLPPYAMRAAMFHHALEMGMKCMCVEDDLPESLLKKFEDWGHNLVRIYNGLSNANHDMRDLLDNAFKDVVSFYGVRWSTRDEWKHLRDFGRYLQATAGKDSFRNFRYWYFEGDSGLFGKRMPDMTINREMARFISDALKSDGSQDGDDLFVSQLVAQEILASFHRERYVDNGNSQRFNEEPDALEEDNRMLRQWVDQHDSLLLAIKDAYEHDFDVPNLNEWSNTVLKGVYDSLKETDDYRIKSALDYAFSTFGAKTSDCEREVISSAQVQLHQNGRRGTVKTPSGHPLGNITERHDGLWTAEYSRAKRQVRDPRRIWRELAVDRDNAIGLLIENRYEKVSVTLNGGTPGETWAHVQNLNMSRFFEVDAVCEFWDANHGIKVGDEISILGAGQVKTLSDPDTHGIVKSVNNHNVVVAVSRHH